MDEFIEQYLTLLSPQLWLQSEPKDKVIAELRLHLYALSQQRGGFKSVQEVEAAFGERAALARKINASVPFWKIRFPIWSAVAVIAGCQVLPNVLYRFFYEFNMAAIYFGVVPFLTLLLIFFGGQLIRSGAPRAAVNLLSMSYGGYVLIGTALSFLSSALRSEMPFVYGVLFPFFLLLVGRCVVSLMYAQLDQGRLLSRTTRSVCYALLPALLYPIFLLATSMLDGRDSTSSAFMTGTSIFEQSWDVLAVAVPFALFGVLAWVLLIFLRPWLQPRQPQVIE
jgi:hypothetical protein